MSLRFHKMSGAGNDFILIDNFDGAMDADAGPLARRLCPRRTSVGADGLVTLEPDPKGQADFSWRFHNADGSEAEMCGNAARCAAWLAHQLGRAGRKLSFRTRAGLIRAEVKGNQVRVEMPGPHTIKTGLDLKVGGGGLEAGFINTGVPHVVVRVDQAEAIDLAGQGAKVRHHPDFAPAGTNANFYSLAAGGVLRMRTFERGVEAETLACGTGAVAVALMAHLKGRAAPPTRVLMSSGAELVIDYQANPKGIDPWPGPVLMEGPVTLVYTAELSEEVL
ncbi:MAG: diaminopimelate epimerase [Deltaproteobacteria bacterium]|nr:diaminopimelate epimerase [Deltaproteobacteria bacterium]